MDVGTFFRFLHGFGYKDRKPLTINRNRRDIFGWSTSSNCPIASCGALYRTSTPRLRQEHASSPRSGTVGGNSDSLLLDHIRIRCQNETRGEARQRCWGKTEKWNGARGPQPYSGVLVKIGKLFLLVPNESVGRQGLCFPIFIETPESFAHEGEQHCTRKRF